MMSTETRLTRMNLREVFERQISMGVCTWNVHIYPRGRKAISLIINPEEVRQDKLTATEILSVLSASIETYNLKVSWTLHVEPVVLLLDAKTAARANHFRRRGEHGWVS